jgi:HD-like signal output (HDOD) protein
MSTLTANRPRLAARAEQSTEVLVDRLFARISEVSSIPDVALGIIRLANDPASEAEDLLQAIQQDAALALRIMRTVNSSFYGLPRQVADLKRAITLLGFKEIRNLVLSAYVADLFRAGGGHGTYSRRGLWNHLVGVGAVARLIARVGAQVPPQEAYLAGLLHDVGLILLDQYLHRPFCQVVDALGGDRPICEVEREILGFDHALLGQYVAARWQLPEPLTTAVRHHHEADRYDGPQGAIVHVVALANTLSHRKGRTSLGVRDADLPSPQTFAALELREQEVAEIWERVDEALQAADAMAGL